MTKKRLVIKGPKIHNIGYRFFLYDEALRIGLSCFDAKNIKNDLDVVNVLVGGEEDRVRLFLDFAKTNYPPEAEVGEVIEEEYEGDVRSVELFERSFMLEQQSKLAVYGLNMLEKHDEHIGLTRDILTKQDEHIGITKNGFESVTHELKGFKELHEELRELRHEVNELKGAVARIEKKVTA